MTEQGINGMTYDELIRYIRNYLGELGCTQKDAAKEWGISAAYLNDVLQGNRKPGKKLLKALRLQAETRYYFK